MKPVSAFIKIFLYSNSFVSLCAASLAYVTKQLTGSGLNNFSVEAAVFFSTLAVYNFQRIVNPIRAGIPLTERQQWIQDNRKILVLITLLSIAAFILIFINDLNNRGILIFLLFPVGIISVWYATDLKKDRRWPLPGRLRNLPFIKLFLIAVVWGVMTVFFPYYAAYGTPVVMNELYWLFGERMLFVMAITLPFDIRDMWQDKQLGLKTFPIVLGVKRIKILCYLLLLLFGISVILRSWFFYGNISPLNWSLVLSGLITAMIVSFSGSQRKEIFYSGLVESTMLIQGLLVLLAGNI